MIVSWLTDGPTDSWFMTNGAKISLFFFFFLGSLIVFLPLVSPL